MQGPILGIIAIVVLNALFIWLALGLRRHILAIAEPNPAQNEDTHDALAEPNSEQHEDTRDADEQLILQRDVSVPHGHSGRSNAER